MSNSINETIYPSSTPTYMPTINKNITDPVSSDVGAEIGIGVAIGIATGIFGSCLVGVAVYFRKAICLKVIESYILTQREGIFFNICSGYVDDYQTRQGNIAKLRDLAKKTENKADNSNKYVPSTDGGDGGSLDSFVAPLNTADIELGEMLEDQLTQNNYQQMQSTNTSSMVLHLTGEDSELVSS